MSRIVDRDLCGVDIARFAQEPFMGLEKVLPALPVYSVTITPGYALHHARAHTRWRMDVIHHTCGACWRYTDVRAITLVLLPMNTHE